MDDLKQLLQEKHSLYNKEKIKIEKELSKLPKGSITKRKIYHQYYYYLSFRKDGKVRHEYIGKTEPVKLAKQIDRRRQLEKELKKVKEALRMLRSVRPKIV